MLAKHLCSICLRLKAEVSQWCLQQRICRWNVHFMAFTEMLIHVNWDRFITSWSTSYSSPVQPSDETKWETKQSLLREWQMVPWCIIMWHMEWLSLNPFTAIPVADLQGILALSSHRLGQLSRNLWKCGFQFPTGQNLIPVLYVMLRWEDLMALNLWIHSCCSMSEFICTCM